MSKTHSPHFGMQEIKVFLQHDKRGEEAKRGNCELEAPKRERKLLSQQ